MSDLSIYPIAKENSKEKNSVCKSAFSAQKATYIPRITLPPTLYRSSDVRSQLSSEPLAVSPPSREIEVGESLTPNTSESSVSWLSGVSNNDTSGTIHGLSGSPLRSFRFNREYLSIESLGETDHVDTASDYESPSNNSKSTNKTRSIPFYSPITSVFSYSPTNSVPPLPPSAFADKTLHRHRVPIEEDVSLFVYHQKMRSDTDDDDGLYLSDSNDPITTEGPQTGQSRRRSPKRSQAKMNIESRDDSPFDFGFDDNDN